MGGRGVQLGQVHQQLLQFDAAALALVGGQLLVALQVGDADLDAAFGEFGFLGGAFEFAQAGAGRFGLGRQGFAVDLGIGETGLVFGQLFVQSLEAGLGLFAGSAQVLFLDLDFFQVLAQSRGALAGLLGLLLQARVLQLDVMHPASDFRHALARRGNGLGHLLPGDFGAGDRGARLVGNQLLRLDLALQVLDFLLARQQAGLLGIRRVEAHAVGVDQVAGLDHAGTARGQTGAHGQGLGHVGGRVDAAQPLVE